jgi:hypothetical protein
MQFQIIAGIDVSPRKFKGVEVEGPKGWKNSLNAQQSPLLRKIKKRMQERKKKLKMFQNSHLYDHLFAVFLFTTFNYVYMGSFLNIMSFYQGV